MQSPQVYIYQIIHTLWYALWNDKEPCRRCKSMPINALRSVLHEHH